MEGPVMGPKQHNVGGEARIRSHFPDGAASVFAYTEHRFLILPIASFSEPANTKTKELRMSLHPAKQEWGADASRGLDHRTQTSSTAAIPTFCTQPRGSASFRVTYKASRGVKSHTFSSEYGKTSITVTVRMSSCLQSGKASLTAKYLDTMLKGPYIRRGNTEVAICLHLYPLS